MGPFSVFTVFVVVIYVFGVVDKTSSSFSAHGKIGSITMPCRYFLCQLETILSLLFWEIYHSRAIVGHSAYLIIWKRPRRQRYNGDSDFHSECTKNRLSTALSGPAGWAIAHSTPQVPPYLYLGQPSTRNALKGKGEWEKEMGKLGELKKGRKWEKWTRLQNGTSFPTSSPAWHLGKTKTWPHLYA